MRHVLIDGNHLAARNKFASERSFGTWSPEAWEYMCLESLFNLMSRFQGACFVFCVDSPNSWRKEVYPEYKAHRAIKRSKDPEEARIWQEYMDTYAQFTDTIQKYLPLLVLQAPNCEADDFIGVLSDHLPRTTIIGSDKDFIQCLTYSTDVEIWDPITHVFRVSDNPKRDKFVKICCRDNSDNIPPIGHKVGPCKALKLFNGQIEWTAELREGFDRNSRLMDFNRIPDDIAEKVLTAFYLDTHGVRFDAHNFYMHLQDKGMNDILSRWDTIKARLEKVANAS